jgi:hypothetical protein
MHKAYMRITVVVDVIVHVAEIVEINELSMSRIKLSA